jgi:hypothetical protein
LSSNKITTSFLEHSDDDGTCGDEETIKIIGHETIPSP